MSLCQVAQVAQVAHIHFWLCRVWKSTGECTEDRDLFMFTILLSLAITLETLVDSPKHGIGILAICTYICVYVYTYLTWHNS